MSQEVKKVPAMNQDVNPHMTANLKVLDLGFPNL
jgi:hypothetical protein